MNFQEAKRIAFNDFVNSVFDDNFKDLKEIDELVKDSRLKDLDNTIEILENPKTFEDCKELCEVTPFLETLTDNLFNNE